ncbi:hypothetical protein B484DRAFT_430072 [Ochromonadaceae sp. CCMP2298]|nr:hypothetical protein B484DRAFT_430072 [Ochromonadaceae sp. CCMP2298]
MAAKGGFSLADLQQGAKKLQTAAPSETKPSNSSLDADEEGLKRLEDLYTKYNGDLDIIFGELKADPAKAKKPHHRPKGASEFARQYMQGFYSAIEDDLLEADGKGPSAAADAKFAHK